MINWKRTQYNQNQQSGRPMRTPVQEITCGIKKTPERILFKSLKAG